MTKRDLTRILNTWKKRLPLDEWTVTIDWDHPCSDDKNAEITVPYDYHVTEIRLDAPWRHWSRRTANRVILHELCHLLLRDLDVVAIKAAELLGTEANRLSRALWIHAEEGLVDAMAVRLTQAWGLV